MTAAIHSPFSSGLLRFQPSWLQGRFRWPGLGLLVWLLVCWPASALELRVAIRDGVDQLTVGTSTNGVVKSAAGQPVSQTPAGQSLTLTAAGSQVQVGDWRGNGFWVEPSGDGYVFVGDRWYRGRVFVVPYNGRMLAVNYVDLEEYLYSVVGGEMPTSWPIEALKAQAVAARTFVLYRRQGGDHPYFDVGSTTAAQVYRGLAEEAPSTLTAVNSTRGQVLTYNGQFILAAFHSASGGYTENVEDIWVQPLPYLRAVQDFDAGSPVYQWTETVSQSTFQAQVPGIGNLVQATPLQTTARGRVVEMQLQGTEGAVNLSGNDLRRLFRLRSTLFSVAVSGNQIQFSGRGFGHGVGLSQWGAHNLAQQGHTYLQILGHYYQGAQLSQLP
jgi:stage II sporulation protein D